jgi:hypothetical protein
LAGKMEIHLWESLWVCQIMSRSSIRRWRLVNLTT